MELQHISSNDGRASGPVQGKILPHRRAADSFYAISDIEMPIPNDSRPTDTIRESRQGLASTELQPEVGEIESNNASKKQSRISALLRKLVRQQQYPMDEDSPFYTELRICKPLEPQAGSIAKNHKVDECPRGYPRLATLLNSDESFTIFRRFGYIQCRLILEKQTQLAKLECELDHLDQQLAESERDYFYLHTVDIPNDGLGQRRAALISEIEHTFCDYGQTRKTIQSALKINLRQQIFSEQRNR